MLRELFGLYADATCPPGTALPPTDQLRLIPNLCTGPDGGKPSVCPAGTTAYTITTEARQIAIICVPAGTALYDRISWNPIVYPCRTGDYFGVTESGMKCIPAAGPPATTSAASGTGLQELTTRLTSLRAQYTTLANQATATPAQIQTLLPQIQSVNQQIAAVLDKMLAQMQYATAGGNSETYRDQLVEQLARIQSDYNGLKTNTDAMKTLQRIRSFQDTSWQSTLMLYIGFFVLVAGLFALVVVIRRYTNTSASTPSPSPAAMAPLT